MSGRLQRVGVAGFGAFGTALALVAARAGRSVVLWGRDPRQVDMMRSARENAAYLPGVAIPPEIAVSSDPAILRDADLVLIAVPAQAARAAAKQLARNIADGAPVVACAKGIEQKTGFLQTEILAECMPGHPIAALSGPGFAEEIARGLPTAVTIAAAEIRLAHQLCAALSSDTFRPYASDDLAGVELAGAVKNVLAIACGVVAGRGLGESARAALIARGLAEMTRLGAALGARAETFMGLAGVGDLVLTATSPKSRNTAFGISLGLGRAIPELMIKGAPLAEGAYTARIASDLAERHHVETPIVAAVAALVEGRLSVDAAIEALITRPLKAESDWGRKR
jgi:glycerol-3-phosphate dehydrogenase (NAD(P)+)